MEENHESRELTEMRRELNTSSRGFASMDPERQRTIASEGGKAAHVKGKAHEFNSEEARVAGRKGGETVSRNREHMAEIGRRGGKASGQNRRNGEPGPSQPSGNSDARESAERNP